MLPPRSPPQAESITKADMRDGIRQARSKSRHLVAKGALNRNQLDDRACHTGQPPLEVRCYDLDFTDIDDCRIVMDVILALGHGDQPQETERIS